MAIDRQLAWSAVIADMKLCRSPREEIREEAMRRRITYASYSLQLTAWRRQDGVRQVFQIFEIEADHIPNDEVCVYLAVYRPRDGGPAKRIAIHRADDSGGIPFAMWLRMAKDRGANELHVCQLCDTPERRTSLIKGLFPEAAGTQVAA